MSAAVRVGGSNTANAIAGIMPVASISHPLWESVGLSASVRDAKRRFAAASLVALHNQGAQLGLHFLQPIGRIGPDVEGGVAVQ